MSTIKRCGTCLFAKLSPQIMAQDISKRICYGAPPSASYVQRPGSPMGLQMVRPVVSVTEDACSLYRGKDEEDVARDDQHMRDINEMRHAEAGTKQ